MIAARGFYEDTLRRQIAILSDWDQYSCKLIIIGRKCFCSVIQLVDFMSLKRRKMSTEPIRIP